MEISGIEQKELNGVQVVEFNEIRKVHLTKEQAEKQLVSIQAQIKELSSVEASLKLLIDKFE